MITLTLKEIMHLAEFAGLNVSGDSDADELKTEFTIAVCPKEGVRNDGEESDPDSVSQYTHIVYCTEYPEEGCMGLGDELSTNTALTGRAPE